MTKPANPRPPTPIESFGAPVFNALIEGSKRRIEVPDISYRDAVKFRQRCHQLRNRMRETGHTLAAVAAKTKISIQWDHNTIPTLYSKKKVPYPADSDSRVTLVIEPFDDEFTAALQRAGIDTHRPVTPDGAAPPPADTTTPVPSLDTLLGNLK